MAAQAGVHLESKVLKRRNTLSPLSVQYLTPLAHPWTVLQSSIRLQALPIALVQLCLARLIELEQQHLWTQHGPRTIGALSQSVSINELRPGRALIHVSSLPPLSTVSSKPPSRRLLHSSGHGVLARRPRHPYRPPIGAHVPAQPVKPISLPPRRSILWLLPAFLRPSIRHLIGLDFVLDAESPQNQDMANAQNGHYVQLRNNAIHEGDLMGQCFSQSKQAYSSGDGERAHELSMQGKEHQRKRDELNDQAAQWIFNGQSGSARLGASEVCTLVFCNSHTFGLFRE